MRGVFKRFGCDFLALCVEELVANQNEGANERGNCWWDDSVLVKGTLMQEFLVHCPRNVVCWGTSSAHKASCEVRAPSVFPTTGQTHRLPMSTTGCPNRHSRPSYSSSRSEGYRFEAAGVRGTWDDHLLGNGPKYLMKTQEDEHTCTDMENESAGNTRVQEHLGARPIRPRCSDVREIGRKRQDQPVCGSKERRLRRA